jgi:hypothetical protein
MERLDPDDYDPNARLLASLVAGLLAVRLTDHPLVAVALVALALAAIWGWP